jgi:thiol-disulfide isomerase/thioredoxin
MKRILLSTLIAALAAINFGQDKPQAIAKKDLPDSAVCAVCSTLGSMMTAAKPNAGVMYRGKAYYFHDKGMFAMYMKDPDAFSDPVLPRPMPTFLLKDTAGKEYSADDFKGKVVLVDFWATWCIPCRKTKTDLEGIYDQHKADGVQLLSVDTDEQKKILDKFLKENAFSNPVLFDNKKTYAAWHVTAIPAVFLVKDGHVIAQWAGAMDAKVYGDAVEAALK